ncbi:hypothetical protein GBAR_LOCUS8478, partial [Geodia barretti]
TSPPLLLTVLLAVIISRLCPLSCRRTCSISEYTANCGKPQQALLMPHPSTGPFLSTAQTRTPITS